MWIHEIHVFELRIGDKFQCMILAVMSATYVPRSGLNFPGSSLYT